MGCGGSYHVTMTKPWTYPARRDPDAWEAAVRLIRSRTPDDQLEALREATKGDLLAFLATHHGG